MNGFETLILIIVLAMIIPIHLVVLRLVWAYKQLTVALLSVKNPWAHDAYERQIAAVDPPSGQGRQVTEDPEEEQYV